ncbi:MAG: hypothetical protein IJ190_00955 [Prevotella sp.]|nr:hypothetical protein [Prevotella sp.]
MDKTTNVTIGNWYLLQGTPTKVSPENIAQFLESGCLPMPLEDSILRDNGWHTTDGRIWENRGSEVSICLEKFPDGYIWTAGDYNITEINYVHQLQDALRLIADKKVLKVKKK